MLGEKESEMKFKLKSSYPNNPWRMHVFYTCLEQKVLLLLTVNVPLGASSSFVKNLIINVCFYVCILLVWLTKMVCLNIGSMPYIM